MIIQSIKFRSRLSEEEVMKVARERKPQFQALPGLLQKYYVKLPGEGSYGGIYIWDSVESLKAYRTSDLAASIPDAYGVIEAPQVETMDILFQLRD